MKRLTLLFVALIATLATAFAEPESAKARYTHTYDFHDFTELATAHAFVVELTFADRYEVRVDVPDFIEPYLMVRQRGEKVLLELEQRPDNIQHKMKGDDGRLKAYVTMPKLTLLQMSGASKLSATGKLALGSESLRIQLSGATELKDLTASGQGSLTLQLSGASKAELEASFPKGSFDLSGAAKLRYEGNAEQLSIEESGASSAQLDGDYKEVVAGLSGSSKLSTKGDEGRLTLELSGASKFESSGKAAWAIVELNGASRCQLSVSEQLRYTLSGASSLKVRDLGAKIKGDCSRGSKIEVSK